MRLAYFLPLAAILAGCQAEVEPSFRGCKDCGKSAGTKDSAGTSASGETESDPYSNVARPVTPATPNGGSEAASGTPVVGAPAAAPAAPGTTPAPAPTPSAPPPATSPITRKYLNGDHLYTRNAAEAPEWVNEGQPFLVFDSAQPNTLPIHRCLAGTQHFVSNDPGCEGQVSEGALGWLSSTPGADRFELIRCRNATGSDHLASTREECDAAGYIIEGALGFAQRP